MSTDVLAVLIAIVFLVAFVGVMVVGLGGAIGAVWAFDRFGGSGSAAPQVPGAAPEAAPVPSELAHIGFCDLCGHIAPVSYVRLNQNVGLLLMRLHSEWRGDACRRCGLARARSMTTTTALVGWLGVMSAVMGPLFVVMNLGEMQKLRALEPETKDHSDPLRDEEIAALLPFTEEIGKRLRNEPLVDIAADLSGRTVVRPVRAWLYVARTAGVIA